MKTGRSVVVSCNLPSTSPLLLVRTFAAFSVKPEPLTAVALALLQVVAEKHLLQLLT